MRALPCPATAAVALAMALVLAVPVAAQRTAGSKGTVHPSKAMDQAILLRVLPEVENRLGSGKPETQAWGAYLAGRYGVRSAIPRLCELLREHGSETETRRRFVAMALLDALIQLDGEPATGDLRSYVGTYTLTPAVILASRNPKAHADLLRHVARTAVRQGKERVAAGHLLTGMADKSFFADCLAALTTAVDVSVVSSETDGIDHLGFGVGGAVGARYRIPNGYPPLFTYKLHTWPAVGHVVVVTQGLSRPVYYKRSSPTVSSLRHPGFSSLDLDEDRVAWVRRGIAKATKTAVSKVAALDPDPTLRVVYTDDDAFVKAVEAARAKAMQQFRDLEEAARNAGLLPSDVPAIEARVVVKVGDHRADSVEVHPLPAPKSWSPKAP